MNRRSGAASKRNLAISSATIRSRSSKSRLGGARAPASPHGEHERKKTSWPPMQTHHHVFH